MNHLITEVIDGESYHYVAQELEARIRTFNEQHAGPLNPQPLVLTVRDSAGQLIADLLASSSGKPC